jgi:hypothetical protein
MIAYRWRGTTSRGEHRFGTVSFQAESSLGAMVAARYRSGWRHLLVVRGDGPVPPRRDEDPVALIDRSADRGQRVWWAEAGQQTSGETAGTYDDPDVLDRDELDLSHIRAHIRAGHRHAALKGIPRANRDLVPWHAEQHHRYGSHGHHHRGRFTVLLGRDGRVPVAKQPRPLGWFTGQESVSREQAAAEFRQRTRAEVSDG